MADGDNMATDNAAGLKRKFDDLEDIETGHMNPGNTEPYDVTQECLPNSIVYNTDYIRLRKGIDYVGRLITDPLQKSEDTSSTAHGLLTVVNERLFNSKKEKVLVGISGIMGSGKSSTLNSLWSLGMIARSDKSGSSVTLVPHMYSGPMNDQASPYLAVVSFFPRAERAEFFKVALASFFRAENQHDDDEEEHTSSRRGANDDEVDIDARDTVVDAMHGLFLERRECVTKRATREFLKSAQSEDDEDILKKLNDWANKLIREASGGKGAVLVEGSTPQDLMKQLEVFSMEATDDDNNRVLSLWPLVTLIHCHFENPYSKLDISFLDAPGSSDNHIRRKSALKLRRECTHAIVIVNAARANNEGTLSKDVRSVRGRGSGRVWVVVTGSDDVDPITMIGGTSADRQRIAKLQAMVQRMGKELNVTKMEFNKASNDMEMCKLFRKKAELEQRILRATNADKATRIRMRSANTAALLQPKLRDATGFDSDIHIVSVSNTEYKRSLDGFTAETTPVLSVEQTNIPPLRRAISEFPNKARMNEIEHLYRVHVPSLLRRTALYTERTASDRKLDIECIVDSPLARYENNISQFFDRMATNATQEILMELRKGEPEWVDKAAAKCEKWAEEFKASPMLNLMKTEGHRRETKKQRGVDLTYELQQIAGKKMARCFARMINELFQIQDHLVEELDAMFTQMRDAIVAEPSSSFMNLEPFYQYIDAEAPRLASAARQGVERVINGMEIIKEYISLGNEDAYMTELMRPIYNQVQVLKGGKAPGMQKAPKRPPGGWPAHRHTVFKAEVSKSNGLWTGVYKCTEQDIDTLLVEERARVVKEVGKVFADFRSGFDIMCEAKDSDDPEEENTRALLKANMEKAQVYMAGEMKDAYVALENSCR